MPCYTILPTKGMFFVEEKILLTVKEVAQILRTNVSYVNKLINAGRLPAMKLGNRKVLRSTLMKLLSESEGWDLTDPDDVVPLALEDEEVTAFDSDQKTA